jgi:hypothetical protein
MPRGAVRSEQWQPKKILGAEVSTPILAVNCCRSGHFDSAQLPPLCMPTIPNMIINAMITETRQVTRESLHVPTEFSEVSAAISLPIALPQS